MRVKIDWGERWGILIPYSDDRHGYTHFLSHGAVHGTRASAITSAVREWCLHALGYDLPTRNEYDLQHKHKRIRMKAWRALRARGFREIPIRVRGR